ncbi:FAD-dependent monooxygenase [Comamonadaceae bacterium G21597-S1]|nr:FAD-dependent monooxygenase [Comamonadaceae bacterium G21597-S1]
MPEPRLLVSGAGIAGLAAALACGRADRPVRVIERAAAFGEVGAGIQIGPNVTRILHGWGLEQSLARLAAFPDRLQVRSAISGRELAAMPLGDAMRRRYGAPYATVHRADLHRLLLDAVDAQGGVQLDLDSALLDFEQSSDAGVTVTVAGGRQLQSDALLGADGLWSPVRRQLLDDGDPQPTGHLAYRALLRQSDLPAVMRSGQVTAWLGPQLHVVQYPVRGGEWLNLVVVVHGAPDWLRAANATPGQLANWNQHADRGQLLAALGTVALPLRALVEAVPAWRLWILCDRAPMSGPGEHGRGRVVLLGDAAHPMRPYLAQGAGMAIEDAQAIATALADRARPVEVALAEFARLRWPRNRRVQRRSRRNGQVFHASGPVRWGRDAALALLGARLLELPWLYGGAGAGLGSRVDGT